MVKYMMHSYPRKRMKNKTKQSELFPKAILSQTSSPRPLQLPGNFSLSPVRTKGKIFLRLPPPNQPFNKHLLSTCYVYEGPGATLMTKIVHLLWNLV